MFLLCFLLNTTTVDIDSSKQSLSHNDTCLIHSVESVIQQAIPEQLLHAKLLKVSSERRFSELAKHQICRKITSI